MVVLPSGIGTLYTVRIFGGLQAAGISRIISCFFEIISAKYRLKESFPLHVTHDCPLSIIDHRVCFFKECTLAHSRTERGRLRQTSSSRECASLAGRAFLCTREFQRNFLVHKKDCSLRPVDRKSSLFDIIMKIEEISLLLLRM